MGQKHILNGDLIVSGSTFTSGSSIFTNGLEVTGSLNVAGSTSITNGATVYNNITINTSNLPVLNLYDSLQDHTWQFRSNGTSLYLRDQDNTRLWIGGVGSGNGGKVGINTINSTAQLTVKGSGTTSSTTALRVENSNASASLEINDAGTLNINNPSTPTRTALINLKAKTSTTSSYMLYG